MYHLAHRAIGAQPPRRRLAAFLLALTATGAVTAAAPAAGASATAVTPVTVTSHFVWTATSANITGPVTFIDNLATNSRPGDLLFITHNWTQGGVCVTGHCVDDASPVGVWYDTGSQKWAIINEDLSAMQAGASFNVLVVPAASSSVVVQHATTANSDHESTYINSSLTNGQPGARLMITPVLNSESGVTFNKHFTGVWYDPSRRKWAILNEDAMEMPFNASFNVMVGTGNSGGGTSALQTATTTNINGRITFITHNSLTTGNPNEILFETPNLNPGGGTHRIYDPQPIATYWSPHGHAAIFNDNTVSMPLGAAFNLIIYQS
jgi:hypothetical protein